MGAGTISQWGWEGVPFPWIDTFSVALTYLSGERFLKVLLRIIFRRTFYIDFLKFPLYFNKLT